MDYEIEIPESMRPEPTIVVTGIVSSVKVEIMATDGHKKVYMFQSVEQANAFLEEFDYEKILD